MDQELGPIGLFAQELLNFGVGFLLIFAGGLLGITYRRHGFFHALAYFYLGCSLGATRIFQGIYLEANPEYYGAQRTVISLILNSSALLAAAIIVAFLIPATIQSLLRRSRRGGTNAQT